MIKLHVTSKSSKKLVIAEATVASVTEGIKLKFGKTNEFDLLYWCEGVGDWMEFDQDVLSCMSEDKIHKIKVVDHGEDQALSTPEKTVPLPKNVVSTQERTVATPEKGPQPGPSTCNRGPDEGSMTAFPVKYRLPTSFLSPGLKIRQAKGQPLDQGDINHLLVVVYNHVTTHYENAFYPTSEQYLNMASAVLAAFPVLLQSNLLSDHEVQLQWKVRLQRKFQNSRKRQDCNVLVVQAKKRKRTETADQEKTDNVTFGVQNYLPQRCESEDDLSLERHREWLAVEWRKRGMRDTEKVERLMRLTLSERRKLIVEDKKQVQEILSAYPWLSGADGMVKEFLRLGARVEVADPREAVVQGLSTHSKVLLQLVRNKKKIPDVVKDLLDTKKSDELYTYARVCAVILGSQLLLGEKTDSLFIKVQDDQDVQQGQTDVCIQFTGPIHKADALHVILDGMQVAEAPDVSSALAILIAALFVYNVEYPEKCKHSLGFFASCLIGIKDDQNNTKKTRALMFKLGERENRLE